MYSTINKTNIKNKNHKSSQINPTQFVTLPIQQIYTNTDHVNSPIMYSLYNGTKKRSTHKHDFYYNKSSYFYPQMIDTSQLVDQTFPYYGSNVHLISPPMNQAPVILIQPVKKKNHLKNKEFATDSNTPRMTE